MKMPTLPLKKAIQVALLDFGERLEVNKVNLEYLARKLNSLQSSFVFTIEAPITSARIGDPSIEDDRGAWYELEPMFDVLRRHDCFVHYSYVIGITHLCMTEKNAHSGKTWGDYFSLSDKEKVAVISVNQNVFRYNSPSKNVYQYLSYLIVLELLIMLCKTDLIHTKSNYCFFDDCVDRSSFTRCIDLGEICEECHAELKRCNIGEEVINNVMAVLKWCKTKSMRYSTVTALSHPLTLLALGGILGWFGSALVAPGHYLAALCPLLVPVFVFVYVRYLSR
jgi:hypothetical protein